MGNLIKLFLAAVLLAYSGLWAETIDADKAKNLALRFVEAKHGRQAGENLRLRHTARSARDSGRQRIGRMQDEEQALFYVFNINEDGGGGFVIIAGDNLVRPVLGFSENGNFDEEKLPPNFEFWMNFLSEQIVYAQENISVQSEEIREEWNTL